MQKKVLAQDVVREAVIPKKAKEGGCMYVTYFSKGLQQYLHFVCSSDNVFETVPPERWVLNSVPSNQGLSCDCSGQQSGVELVLCDFQG